MSTQLINRAGGDSSPVACAPSCRRARPADDARRRLLGVPAAVPNHAPASARPGLLVAVRPAAAPVVMVGGSSSRCLVAPARDRGPPGRGALMEPPARTRPLAVRDRASCCSGCCLLARALVGEEVWRRRAWRAYLWPSLLFLMGVLMWPVMVFYTNSMIHMLAHGAWAQAMMLAGRGRARARAREAAQPWPGGWRRRWRSWSREWRSSSTSRTAGSSPRSPFLHHVIGLDGADRRALPAHRRSSGRRSPVWQLGIRDHVRRARGLPVLRPRRRPDLRAPLAARREQHR